MIIDLSTAEDIHLGDFALLAKEFTNPENPNYFEAKNFDCAETNYSLIEFDGVEINCPLVKRNKIKASKTPDGRYIVEGFEQPFADAWQVELAVKAQKETSFEDWSEAKESTVITLADSQNNRRKFGHKKPSDPNKSIEQLLVEMVRNENGTVIGFGNAEPTKLYSPRREKGEFGKPCGAKMPKPTRANKTVRKIGRSESPTDALLPKEIAIQSYKQGMEYLQKLGEQLTK